MHEPIEEGGGSGLDFCSSRVGFPLRIGTTQAAAVTAAYDPLRKYVRLMLARPSLRLDRPRAVRHPCYLVLHTDECGRRAALGLAIKERNDPVGS